MLLSNLVNSIYVLIIDSLEEKVVENSWSKWIEKDYLFLMY